MTAPCCADDDWTSLKIVGFLHAKDRHARFPFPENAIEKAPITDAWSLKTAKFYRKYCR